VTLTLVAWRREGFLRVRAQVPVWPLQLALTSGGIVGESCKQATINILPDEAVLRIFDFCRKDHDVVWKWLRLAHVCRKWRQIVFASPRRLDIQIRCTYGSPVRENLRCWPALPIAIDYCGKYDTLYAFKIPKAPTPPVEDWNDIMAALKHPDRVCSIRLYVKDSMLEEMAVVLQSPYPWLTSLSLRSVQGVSPALPDAFLGGYVPRLRKCVLTAIPFPTFPRFLRSAKDLVDLALFETPPTGYISAGMVASLAAFTKLESLHISFAQSSEPQASQPDQRLAVPLTPIVFPALSQFLFHGTRDYLEDLVAQMETPQLANLSIKIYSSDPVVQLPQLFQFISRAEYLKPAKFRRARARFSEAGSEAGARIILDCSRHPCHLELEFFFCYVMPVPCMVIQLLGELLSQCSHIISHVRDLSIAEYDLQLQSDDLTELWLPFLRPFTAVKTLRTCSWLAAVLEELEIPEDSTVLPALQSIKIAEVDSPY
jgi:hypothetical protein